jgi:hypothetical protein
MDRARAGIVMLLLAFAALTGRSAAQEPAPTPVALRVFLDCEPWLCDLDFLRTEITWVNWVRDRAGSDVHLLVTAQTTGGGGQESTIRFIGQGGQAGTEDELQYVSPGTATADERRRGLARIIRVGLGPFATRAGGTVRLDVGPDGRAGPPAASQQPPDRWKHWVFRIGANGFFNGESRARSSDLFGSVRATRITDEWKLRFELEASRNSSHFVFDDGSSYDSRLTSSGASVLAVRSLGSHWSAGLNASARRSDRQNQDLALRLAPGVEFNVYPYSQSTRRQLTLLYEVGLTGFQYRDTTIYNRLSETRAGHSLTASLVTKQPWGSTNLSLEGGTYLNDWSQNHLTLFAGVSMRLVKGLEANLMGSYGRIRDQLYLPKEGATDEEVLLRLRQLQTSYNYFVSAGLSYTFGSIFNNIVNPRFGGTGGGGVIMMF